MRANLALILRAIIILSNADGTITRNTVGPEASDGCGA
jgi:hypothetical protein